MTEPAVNRNGNSRALLRHEAVLERKPEEIARQVVLRSGQTQPPLDLESLVEFLGAISIARESLKSDGYLIEYSNGSAEIVVSQRNFESLRWRFTVAHEIGHWILNRFIDKTGSHEIPITDTPYPKVERWCDRFAGGLLVPSAWLRDMIGSQGGIGKANLYNEGPARFQVAPEVFEIRISHLSGAWIVHVWKEDDSFSVSRCVPNYGLQYRLDFEALLNQSSNPLRKNLAKTIARSITLPIAGKQRCIVFIVDDKT